MLDPTAVTSFLDGITHLTDINLNDWDKNGDNALTPQDCVAPYGTKLAAVWWKKVFEPYCKSQISPEMKAQYGNDVVGNFNGKPLVPGQMGLDQGDFQFLVWKLKVCEGLSLDVATKVAAKFAHDRYGLNFKTA